MDTPDTMTMMEQRIAGLTARLARLREDERRFQRAAGLEVQMEKDRAAVRELEERRAALKSGLTDLRVRKAAAILATTEALAARMGRALPSGRVAFEITDDQEVNLGWAVADGGPVIPHAGLSGGQRVMFEAALAYALLPPEAGHKLVLVEAAELGPEIGRLLRPMAAIGDAQIVACTCHDVTDIPDGWDVVRVDEDDSGQARPTACQEEAL